MNLSAGWAAPSEAGRTPGLTGFDQHGRAPDAHLPALVPFRMYPPHEAADPHPGPRRPGGLQRVIRCDRLQKRDAGQQSGAGRVSRGRLPGTLEHMHEQRSQADRIVLACLHGAAMRHARWDEPTEAETMAAVAELRELLAGRGNGTALLAETAGLLIGYHAGGLDEPRARAAAHYCMDSHVQVQVLLSHQRQSSVLKVDPAALPGHRREGSLNRVRSQSAPKIGHLHDRVPSAVVRPTA
jgi:hypothetical protein